MTQRRHIILAVKNNLPTESTSGGDLVDWCVARHNNSGFDPEPCRVMSDRLAVISSTSCDDAFLSFIVRELYKTVQCTPFLERACTLQILELEVDLASGYLTENLRQYTRGCTEVPLDAMTGCLDVGETQHLSLFWSVSLHGHRALANTGQVLDWASTCILGSPLVSPIL